MNQNSRTKGQQQPARGLLLGAHAVATRFGLAGVTGRVVAAYTLQRLLDVVPDGQLHLHNVLGAPAVVYRAEHSNQFNKTLFALVPSGITAVPKAECSRSAQPTAG